MSGADRQHDPDGNINAGHSSNHDAIDRGGNARHIRAIVHDDRGGAAGHRNDRIGDVERPLQRTRFGSKLKARRAAVENGAREIQNSPAMRGGDFNVEDRVEPGQRHTASRRRSPFRAGDWNRSMNDVLRFPAWKSGSARILRCMGIVVLMPSITVISRVRRMRAIAS